MKKQHLLILLFACCTIMASAQNWKPAGDNILTSWGENIDPKNVHPEYPRPQLVRPEWQSLNGLWDYVISPLNDPSKVVADGSILVPFPIESALSGVGRHLTNDQVLIYHRSFEVPQSYIGKRVLLHFGAVDWRAEVYVNGQPVGAHTGGYTEFSFDITPYLANTRLQDLNVVVYDGTGNSYQPKGKQLDDPAKIYYTAVSGIWQSVWLEPVNETHLTNYNVVSNIDTKTLTVEPVCAGLRNGDVIKVQLLDGGIGYSTEKPATKVLTEVVARDGKAQIAVPDMKTWSPDSPYLYGLKIMVLRKGKVIDQINGYTAMRKISWSLDSRQYRRMDLNNEHVFHFGPLDQGWWPDGLYTAPSDEALRFDVEKTKAFGYNMIRKHVKVEPARWYYWCDVYGLMVWQDMPSMVCGSSLETNEWELRYNRTTCGKGTDQSIPAPWKQNFYKEWKDIINARKNFPCIVMWIPFNEAWGQFDTKDVTDFTRKCDSTRLVNSASGGNYRFCGDIHDYHSYPEPSLRVFLRDYVNVIGEFGGIGYRIEDHLWKQDGNFSYVKLQDPKEVLDKYISFTELLKEYIGVGISGAVYTQTTDVETETNGLITYDRKVIKMDAEKLKTVNQSVIEMMKKY